MKSAAVVALALLESVQAFQAPAAPKASRASGVTMFTEGDIGVTPPLGVFDPLGLIETRDMRRYEIMEIKHGRGAPIPRSPPRLTSCVGFLLSCTRVREAPASRAPPQTRALRIRADTARPIPPQPPCLASSTSST